MLQKNHHKDQIKMLNMASAFPASKDDEYPGLTEAELLQFKKVANGGEDENDR